MNNNVAEDFPAPPNGIEVQRVKIARQLCESLLVRNGVFADVENFLIMVTFIRAVMIVDKVQTQTERLNRNRPFKKATIVL